MWFPRNDNCNCEKLRSSVPTYLLGLEDSRNKLNKSDRSRTRSLEVFAWQTYGALDERIAFSQEWPHRTCRHRGIVPWCRIVTSLLRRRGALIPSHRRCAVVVSSLHRRCVVASLLCRRCVVVSSLRRRRVVVAVLRRRCAVIMSSSRCVMWHRIVVVLRRGVASWWHCVAVAWCCCLKAALSLQVPFLCVRGQWTAGGVCACASAHGYGGRARRYGHLARVGGVAHLRRSGVASLWCLAAALMPCSSSSRGRGRGVALLMPHARLHTHVAGGICPMQEVSSRVLMAPLVQGSGSCIPWWPCVCLH